jgi:hypothetical protein
MRFFVGAKARRRCDLLKTDYRHAKQNFAGENQGIKKNPFKRWKKGS